MTSPVARRWRRGWWQRRTLPPSRLRLSDLFTEAVAGLLQRPGRTAMTALGTVLGVGALVAVLGLTVTAGGQISQRFTELSATEVTVEEVSTADPFAEPAFPADAERRVRAIEGVRACGVWWPVAGEHRPTVSGVALPGARSSGDFPVIAASPGLLSAVRPTVRQGRLLDDLHDARRDLVAVLGRGVAARLGISTLRPQPAVHIDGVPFAVLGILDDVQRQPELLTAVVVPRGTAEMLWGPPARGQARMLVDARLGAASVVAEQVALALRPDAPGLFRAVAPPDPRSLRDAVTSDVTDLFLVLAGVCLVIGAVSIANTAMVAVLERVPEIGLRRALGARRGHIAGQLIVESLVTGGIGGLVGTALGVSAVVSVALVRQWTALIEPWTVFVAPGLGALVGVLAGLYPALRAARIEPVEALRR